MASRDDAPTRLSWELIAQGAEARIYGATFLGRPAIVKERFKKEYRHPSLDDRLTRERMNLESRCLERARRAGVDAPLLLFLDTLRYRIYMERIEGSTVKAVLLGARQGLSAAATSSIARGIGRGIARLHNCSMVHGDLTTSNMMIRDVSSQAAAPHSRWLHSGGGGGSAAGPTSSPSGGSAAGPSSALQLPPAPDELPLAPMEPSGSSSAAGGDLGCDIVFIDFGLAFVQANFEDKGVDLYVLERALLSTHNDLPDFFPAVLEAYSAESKDAAAVRAKFEAVRLRGRKRLAFG